MVPLVNRRAGLLGRLGAGEDYPGYPLVADARPALLWFFAGLPLLIVLGWWWAHRAPPVPAQLVKDGGQS